MSNSTAPSVPPSPSSSPPPASAPPSSSPPAPPSSSPAVSTTTLPASASTAITTTTNTVAGGTTGADTTIVRTITSDGTTSLSTGTVPIGAASSSAAAIENNGGSGGGGLSTGATTAIAVIIPVAVIALLVGLGIYFWRRRKSKKETEDQRRKAVEEYNYNPNHDPTLPAVGSEVGGVQMSEDHSSGYRGWGATASSGRKMSSTLSGGHTQQLSDSGNSYGDPYNPTSPVGAYSESDQIMHQRDTVASDEVGALGVAPAAGAMAAAGNKGGLRRGPSNASSTYSAGDQSEVDEEPPPMPGSEEQRYELPTAYSQPSYNGYGQHGPYGDGSYGGAGEGGAMPVVRDLNARRNTRIEHGGGYNQQGNSGIAQNF